MTDREEALTNLAEEIAAWADAYPTSVFPDPTAEQVSAVCAQLGFGIERISAMVLRGYTRHWGLRARSALRGKSSKPDWKDAPEWASYLAQDENGGWYWYEMQPRLGQQACDSQVVWESRGDRMAAPCTQDWRETLEERQHE